jgi:hypothetical protein
MAHPAFVLRPNCNNSTPWLPSFLRGLAARRKNYGLAAGVEVTDTTMDN